MLIGVLTMDMFMIETIPSDVDHSHHGNLYAFARWRDGWETGAKIRMYADRTKKEQYLQPINHRVVCALHDELIHYSVDADCAADELQLRIFRVRKDKVIAVEVCEIFAANTTR